MRIEGSNPWAGIDGLNSNKSERSKASDSACNAISSTADDAQLSTDATLGSSLLQRLGDVPEIRQNKVEGLRASIAQGTYQVSSDHIASAMLDDARFSSWS
jgi:flagellar biosynthesis anti-sigma factor FlgM